MPMTVAATNRIFTRAPLLVLSPIHRHAPGLPNLLRHAAGRVDDPTDSNGSRRALVHRKRLRLFNRRSPAVARIAGARCERGALIGIREYDFAISSAAGIAIFQRQALGLPTARHPFGNSRDIAPDRNGAPSVSPERPNRRRGVVGSRVAWNRYACRPIRLHPARIEPGCAALLGPCSLGEQRQQKM